MLYVLTTLLTAAKTIIYYTLVGSLYIGKTLFELITATAIKSSGLCILLLAGVQILLEDFAVFLRDLSDHAGYGLGLVYKSFEYLLGVLIFIYNPISTSLQWICTIISLLFTWISNIYCNASAIISFILVNAKRLLVLFGSGIWFAITIVPIAIISGSLYMATYFGNLIDEYNVLRITLWSSVRNGVNTAIEFFWDVPLEAFLGLAAFAGMGYLSIKYLSHIRASVIRYSRSIQSKIRFKLPDRIRKVRVIREPVKKPAKTDLNDDQAICVVCQNKPKNMLILPCKHVCTCEDCMWQIQRHSGRCPLCRTLVDRTILVYL